MYRMLVAKHEGKRPHGRPGPRWEDFIEMNLTEIRFEGVDSIWLAQNSVQWRDLMNAVMNLRVP
jgi:hypothetical protein